jgi:hypothetical protein
MNIQFNIRSGSETKKVQLDLPEEMVQRFQAEPTLPQLLVKVAALESLLKGK